MTQLIGARSDCPWIQAFQMPVTWAAWTEPQSQA